jgi:hypothetical protein
MKTRMFILFFSVLFVLLGVGCSTPKKLTSSTTEKSSSDEKRKETTTGDIYTLIDTTRKSGLEVTYTKIEFYPPEKIPAGPGPEPEKEPIKGSTNSEPKPANEKPPNNRGAIKSIGQFTLKATEEATGRSESRESNTSDLEEEINNDTDIKVDITEQPAADPYKWRYIFGICIVVILAGVGLYFGFRKSKIVVSIISFFKRFFSS